MGPTRIVTDPDAGTTDAAYPPVMTV
jgi:hypothetical protein